MLTDSQCRAPNRTGIREKRGDGGGLFLIVSPTNKKRWELAYRHGGKQRALQIGAYPAVTLSAARIAREQAKLALQAGRNPAAPDGPPESTAPTLREAAEDWLKVAGAEWKDTHRARVESRLRANVFPALGAKRLDAITAPDVLAAVREVEARGALHISRRTAQAVASIYRFAIASGQATHNPAADLRDAFAAKPRVQHRAMVAPKDMGTFLVRLQGYEGKELTRLALEAVARTAVRTNEIRFAVWSEVEGDLWRIPAARMKMEGVEHLVPLPPQVVRLLERARELGDGAPWLFPGEKGKPMSSNTLIYGLYRLGYHSRGATVHGFRRTFSTWANEQARWHPDAIERQLAHWDRDAIRQAYNAAEHLPARRELMLSWSAWLDAQAFDAELGG